VVVTGRQMLQAVAVGVVVSVLAQVIIRRVPALRALAA
jgi:uncharacterized membrane protein YgaE (UPF0421/DUF939 family)